MWNFPRNSPLILATALRLLSYFAPTAPPLNQVNTRIPPRGEAGCGRLRTERHFFLEVPSVNTLCKAARAERKGMQRTPTLCARSSFVRHNSESVRSCFDAHLLEASTYDLELKTALRAVAVVRSSGNTQPAEFVLVILSVQHVPFFAAF